MFAACLGGHSKSGIWFGLPECKLGELDCCAGPACFKNSTVDKLQTSFTTFIELALAAFETSVENNAVIGCL